VSELEAIIKRQSHPWWKLTLQAAFDSHIKLESRVRELIEEIAELRASHAALVEAAKKVYRVYNLQNGSSFEMYTPCIDKLKAALAEVKK